MADSNTTRTYRIAVVGGDGIGPEVTACAVELLQAACNEIDGLALEFLDAPAGASTYLEQGEALPRSTPGDLPERRRDLARRRAACRASGTPTGPRSFPRSPCGSCWTCMPGIRPARSLAGVATPLAGDPAIDFVVVRENTEGIFASLGAGIVLGDAAGDRYPGHHPTRYRACRPLGVRAGRRRAAARASSEGRRPRVTCVDKANILRSFAFFRKVFDEVAATYPDVAADHLYVDAAAMELVRRPGRFDVLVTENLMGDILSDLAAGLVGGLGVAPSADIGDHHAVFQPCHGTAPDITGQGIANPVAAILSGVMLLDYLADRDDNPAPRAAARRTRVGRRRVPGFGSSAHPRYRRPGHDRPGRSRDPIRPGVMPAKPATDRTATTGTNATRGRSLPSAARRRFPPGTSSFDNGRPS